MSLRLEENLEYQEKTSGVSSSWNSLQIGQKWTLTGDDGWWTSGGGLTNSLDVKHFWICSTSSNIFYSLLMGACRCQEEDRYIRQILNIFFILLWNINIMRKIDICIKIANILYLHFKLWKIIVSRKIDISNRYQQFLFPLKIHWARKSKAWDCSFPPELSKLKFMHTYCWMSTPLWSEQQLHITSGCKPIGQIYLSKHGILVKFVLLMGKVYIGRTCIYRHMILKIKSWTAMISSETKFCSISNFKGENLSGGYIWHWQLVSSLREVYWGVKGDSGQIEWSFYYRQRLMLSINVQ